MLNVHVEFREGTDELDEFRSFRGGGRKVGDVGEEKVDGSSNMRMLAEVNVMHFLSETNVHEEAPVAERSMSRREDLTTN